MNLLFDLDCLSKLHACSAFEKAVFLFPREEHCFFISDTFPYSAKNHAKRYEKKKKHLAEIFSKIADRTLLKGFSELKATIDDISILARLQNFKYIDSGEALLLLNVSRMQNSRLLTGDKRFLTSIVEHEADIKEIVPSFDKKLIFFLQIVHEICKRDEMQIALFSTPEAQESDTELSSIFGGTPNLESIADGVRSYTANFRNICGDFS